MKATHPAALEGSVITQPGSAFVLSDSEDVPQAATIAKRFATDIGAEERHAWRFATIAAELASNVVKHGARGSIRWNLWSTAQGVRLLVVETINAGEFIGPTEVACTDGNSRGIRVADKLERGESLESLGLGLGAVERLADGFEITVSPGEVRVYAQVII